MNDEQRLIKPLRRMILYCIFKLQCSFRCSRERRGQVCVHKHQCYFVDHIPGECGTS
jgi:hypothetical protein